MTPFGTPRYEYESLPSTMDRLTELALDGSPEGTVVVAAEQTAGRGRGGRSWSAPAKSSLLFSLLLRPPLPLADLAAFPLVAGVAIAEGIEAVGGTNLAGSINLKWPNDLFLDDLKVAGILLQTRSGANGNSFVNLGVGINVNAIAPELADGAISLRAFTGDKWSIAELEVHVLDAISQRYREYIDEGSEPGRSAWMQRALYLNREVVTQQSGHEVRGRFKGVGTNGAALIESPHGLVEIVAGDLIRGPRPV